MDELKFKTARRGDNLVADDTIESMNLGPPPVVHDLAVERDADERKYAHDMAGQIVALMAAENADTVDLDMPCGHAVRFTSAAIYSAILKHMKMAHKGDTLHY